MGAYFMLGKVDRVDNYYLIICPIFLMCSLSFRILREKNRKFIVLSVISAVIFSLVYLQFELFATGLLWVYLIAMNFLLPNQRYINL